MQTTPKQRKIAFESVFRQDILPAFEAHGFSRHTRASHRLVKPLGNGLTVLILFELRSFGSGSYHTNVVYYDDEIGEVYGDLHVAAAELKIPTIQADELVMSAEAAGKWVQAITAMITAFVAAHAMHRALLHSSQLRFPKPWEAQVKALLERKSEAETTYSADTPHPRHTTHG